MQKLQIKNGRYYLGETQLITVKQSKKGRCIGCYAQHHACSAMGMRKVCNENGVIFVEKKQQGWKVLGTMILVIAASAWILLKLMK